MYRFIEVEDAREAAILCGEMIAESLKACLDRQQAAYLFLSGGKSPAAVFDELAHKPLPWEAIDVYLVDERWAPDRPEDQNQTLLRRHLLQDCATQARFHPLLQSNQFQDSLQQCNRMTMKLQTPDIVMLGMGLDGHTASLFPDAPNYDHAMQTSTHYVAVHPNAAPYPRISMSFNWLASAKQLILFMPGPDKREAFTRFVEQGQDTSPLQPLILQAADRLTVITTAESQT